MQFTVLLNFKADFKFSRHAVKFTKSVADRYRITVRFINTGIRERIPICRNIKVGIVTSPPSHMYQLKHVLASLRQDGIDRFLCIAGSSYHSAFPGTFSISRHCTKCLSMLLVHCITTEEKQRSCICIDGSTATVYPSEISEDYFMLS